MRRRKGVNNAATAKVEATMASCDSCAVRARRSPWSITTVPTYTPNSVAVREPYTRVRFMRRFMSYRRYFKMAMPIATGTPTKPTARSTKPTCPTHPAPVASGTTYVRMAPMTTTEAA
jgi:hypothetical protein